MASISGDAAMIKELTEGSGDIHSLVASFIYKDEIGDTPISEIEDKFPEFRSKAKTPEFCFAYGGTAGTLISSYGYDPEVAQGVERDYKSGLKGVSEYQVWAKKQVLIDGHILLSPLTGYRAHIYDFPKIKKYLELPDEVKSTYYHLKKIDPNNELVAEIDHIKRRISDSGKQSINYRIQHLGAMSFKYASIYLFNWIVNNGYFGIIKYTIPCHDILYFVVNKLS